ncbi:hypothetical protein A2U01_0102112, partial [Trifolium medium]|nr:hypothetical protein [Trifolium medium]
MLQRASRESSSSSLSAALMAKTQSEDPVKSQRIVAIETEERNNSSTLSNHGRNRGKRQPQGGRSSGRG